MGQCLLSDAAWFAYYGTSRDRLKNKTKTKQLKRNEAKRKRWRSPARGPVSVRLPSLLCYASCLPGWIWNLRSRGGYSFLDLALSGTFFFMVSMEFQGFISMAELIGSVSQLYVNYWQGMPWACSHQLCVYPYIQWQNPVNWVLGGSSSNLSRLHLPRWQRSRNAFL